MIKTILAVMMAAAAVSSAQAAPADKGATTDALIQERNEIQPEARAQQDALIQARDKVGAQGVPAKVQTRARAPVHVVRPVHRARRPVHHAPPKRIVHATKTPPSPPPHR